MRVLPHGLDDGLNMLLVADHRSKRALRNSALADGLVIGPGQFKAGCGEGCRFAQTFQAEIVAVVLRKGAADLIIKTAILLCRAEFALQKRVAKLQMRATLVAIVALGSQPFD